MKKINKFLVLALASTAFLSSCSNDDDATPDLPKGDYDTGYFVLNEGNANPATASISFIGNDGTMEDDVYRTVNPTSPETGTYLQSMFFDDYNAYIISGNADQITVVDRYTFEYKTTISTDFENPRYGAIANGKAYVTNSAGWELGSADDFVTVINLSDYSTSTFAMENAEKVMEEDDMIYFANGYYGSGQTITVLNPSTDATTIIDLGDGNSPNSIVEEDDNLYVLTTNFAGTPNIFEISTASNTITNTIDLSGVVTSPRLLNIEDDIMYFTDATSVYKLDINGTTPSKVLEYTSTSLYGAMYSFTVEDDKIYITDGGDFASGGTAYEYSLTGSLLNTYIVGVGPNGLYFND
ncbi:DUF5074 domain-containing protein [Formosa undariae]|uniref:DUF5074 domain-containing protein n=1 Tax=Formosa undariae TaxID=1325436 RepID=A0ABV5EZN4_9FLAO